MKKALITGINSQDGSYLAELLLEKGYEVHGIIKHSSIENINKLVNLKSCFDKIKIHIAGIDNQLSIYKLISLVKPDECYHLAASSFVSYSFDDEAAVISTNFNSTHYLLSAIKEIVPQCKFYFAGSSEMFGNANETPQNENTYFNPRSIYGISKLASFHVVKNYREQHNMFACTGITYNHESPRRDYIFVTRKITSAVAQIFTGHLKKLELGNIDAIRDWGYAPEYVEAMWRMLNLNDMPKDYIISTGKGHTVKDFLEIAFSSVNLDYKNFIEINSNFFRPSEAVILLGDSSQIKKDLNWNPQKKLEEIVSEMVINDIALLQNQIN